MTTRQQKRAELRRRLKEAGLEIKFEHVGAVCPAGCGYVFSNGFSPISRGKPPAEERVTMCTRCRQVLIIPTAESKPLRVATKEEIAEAITNNAADFALMQALHAWNREEQS